MKKSYVMLAVFASMMALSACSSHDTPLMGEDQVADQLAVGEDFIGITVSNTGVGTRAARPLGSSAAANNVNKVQLKFYKKAGLQWTDADAEITIAGVDGAVVTGKVIDFNNAVAESTPGNKPHVEEVKKIKLSGLAAKTEYRIVAYGYNQTFPYGQVVQGQEGLFSTGSHTLSGYQLEEVFAGFAEAKTQEAQGKFNTAPVVTLTRQVAGMLAYFKIPGYANGKKVETVKVVANNQTNGFQFPNTLLAGSKDFNGLQPTGKEDVLMTFTMKTCAGNYNEVQPNQYYTAAAQPYADNYKAAPHLALVADAFFGARYILPYAAHVDAQTLRVELWGTDTAAPLKTLKVTTATVPTDGTKYNYDIRCNNFYSLGKKLTTDNTSGLPDPDPSKPNPDPQPQPQPGPDPQPQPDPDKPIDLGATDQIIVEINDAWEVLHDMGVEE